MTEDIHPALSSLNSEHVVVLSGEPGVGKTTLAEYLCQVHMKRGYTVEVIEGDVTNHPFNFSNPEEKPSITLMISLVLITSVSFQEAKITIL